MKNFIYRFIYNSKANSLLRNITFPFLKNKPQLQLPPSGIITLKTASGDIKIATNQTSYITKILYWNGYEDFEYSLIFESLIKKVDTFFDIGANFGYYSLLAATSNPDITIHSFEPALGPGHFLKKNIKINNFSNSITHIDNALSKTNGTIDFFEVQNQKYPYIKYNLSGEHNAGTKTTSRDFIKNTVKSITLKDFIISEKTTSIDLIKIDTEGTEVEILNSGIEFLKKFEPIIICETLFNDTEASLENFFNNLNYQFFKHTQKGLEKTNSITRDKDDGVRNCFFVPVSKLSLISEFVI